MSEEKLIKMIEKYTQSATATSMNMETLARAIELLSKDVAELRAFNDRTKDDHTHIQSQLRDILKVTSSINVQMAENHQKEMSRMASIKSIGKDAKYLCMKIWRRVIGISGDTKDMKKLLWKVLAEVIKIASVVALILYIVRGSII